MGSRASDNYTLEPSLGRRREEERERGRARRQDAAEGEGRWRTSSLRFDRVGVDRRLIDSPPRHGNFFEEPAGLLFFCNTYHLTELLRGRSNPTPSATTVPTRPPSYRSLSALASLLALPSARRFDDPNDDVRHRCADWPRSSPTGYFVFSRDGCQSVDPPR